ncbi:MAG: aldo/keto reductase [Lentisphaeria bacterium]|nr:aldo/keto reductase [Lentisphaeria bacterium]
MTSSSYRTLGTSAVTVSTVAMGCWAIVGDATWGPQDERDAVAAIHAALDAGVTFFDTAEGYGDGLSERILGQALRGRREGIVIGSKVSPRHVGSYRDLLQSCERSLTNLATDCIDVYHLHWPARQVPAGEVLEAFERLRQAGKIRLAAVSNFGRGDLGDLLEAGRCEVNQLPYNLLWRAIEFDIVPLCQRHGVSITCYSPLAQGLLTGKFRGPEDVPEGRARTRHFRGARPLARHGGEGAEPLTFDTLRAIREIARQSGHTMTELAIAWLLAQPAVASVLVGARNPEQVRENARAMQVCPGEDVLAALDAATQPLKEHFGANPDMWQSASRYR